MKMTSKEIPLNKLTIPERSCEEINFANEVKESTVVNSKIPAVMYVVSSKPS